MRTKGTRGKILYQLAEAVKDMDKVLIHLQQADEKARESHPRLSEAMPHLVVFASTTRDCIIKLREEI
uniref:Uncharacterized protein n=1 Tax=viral metagenome TaxID=1070528 RepID=A0A6H1ZMW4_9ZZZZ